MFSERNTKMQSCLGFQLASLSSFPIMITVTSLISKKDGGYQLFIFVISFVLFTELEYIALLNPKVEVMTTRQLVRVHLWCLKVFFSRRGYQCGVWRFLGSQWLRARLCCRKISDSIFWLYYFTPRWLAGAMPCPKKVHKKYIQRKDRNRQETKTFLPYFPLFTWWMDEPTLRPKT